MAQYYYQYPSTSVAFPASIPVTQSGTWNITNVSGTVSLPTGAATETTLAAASAKLPATLGQKAMAASMAVTLASDQSAVPSSQSGAWNIANVSGTVSLPTGAATETTLAGASAKLPATLGQKAMTASMAVTIASDQSAVPASQSGTWSTRLNDGAGTSVTVGQKAMASSLPVAIASDQGAVPASQSGTWSFSQTGYTAVNHARNDYTSINVTTAAYVQLLASTSAQVQAIEIFDSSGQTLVLATGGAGSEVDQIYIFPGGNGRVTLKIATSTRVSIKAVSATANQGEIDVNFYG